MIINPWYQFSEKQEVPDIIHAIIEIPQGSKAKYEWDKEAKMLRLDRVLLSSFQYPANYGFIPNTLDEDKDPLDILVISQIALEPLCIVRAQIIGVMRMLDSDQADDKIIAVAADDASVNHMHHIADLPVAFHQELKQFFEQYKVLENKTVRVDEFQDVAIAKEVVAKSVHDYFHS